MKACPFCAEQIQDAAIKCRYCGSMLNEPAGAGIPDEFADVSDGGSAVEPLTKSPIGFKVCASCGKQVHEVEPHSWRCVDCLRRLQELPKKHPSLREEGVPSSLASHSKSGAATPPPKAPAPPSGPAPPQQERETSVPTESRFRRLRLGTAALGGVLVFGSMATVVPGVLLLWFGAMPAFRGSTGRRAALSFLVAFAALVVSASLHTVPIAPPRPVREPEKTWSELHPEGQSKPTPASEPTPSRDKTWQELNPTLTVNPPKTDDPLRPGPATISGTPTTSLSTQGCEDEITAFVMSKKFVEDKLVAPRTAKFPRFTNPEVKVTHVGDCRYDVRAYVDAQNAFGALIRNTYYATLQNTRGTDQWTALSVELFTR